MASQAAGRKKVRFKDMVESVGAIRKSRGWSARESGLDRYVGLEHLDSKCLRISRWDSPDSVGENSDLREFRPGDVIFARRRIYQRKVAVATFPGVASGHALVFRARPEVVLPEFLLFFMQSELFMGRVSRLSVGSLSPTVNLTAIARQEFALPPLTEQRRIARMLAKAEALRFSANELAHAARDLLIATYKGLFESKSASPRRLNEVAEVLMGRQRSPKYQTGQHMVPYLRAANIKDGRLDLADLKEMNFNPKEQATYGLQPGDIVVTEGCGSLSQIGTNAVWSDPVPGPVCFQNTVLRLRARVDVMDPELLRHWASYAYHAGVFAEAARGTSIFHIGSTRCERIAVNVPTGQAAHDAIERLTALEAAQATTRSRADDASVVFEGAVATALGEDN